MPFVSRAVVVHTFNLSTWEAEAGRFLSSIFIFATVLPTRTNTPTKKQPRAGELAQRLRAPTALPEVLSSIPSNHMVAHNHL